DAKPKAEPRRDPLGVGRVVHQGDRRAKIIEVREAQEPKLATDLRIPQRANDRREPFTPAEISDRWALGAHKLSRFRGGCRGSTGRTGDRSRGPAATRRGSAACVDRRRPTAPRGPWRRP